MDLCITGGAGVPKIALHCADFDRRNRKIENYYKNVILPTKNRTTYKQVYSNNTNNNFYGNERNFGSNTCAFNKRDTIIVDGPSNNNLKNLRNTVIGNSSNLNKKSVTKMLSAGFTSGESKSGNHNNKFSVDFENQDRFLKISRLGRRKSSLGFTRGGNKDGGQQSGGFRNFEF